MPQENSMLTPHRLAGESFEEYKVRRARVNEVLHERLRSGIKINKYSIHNVGANQRKRERRLAIKLERQENVEGKA